MFTDIKASLPREHLEFDYNGKPISTIAFTDHGRPHHPNPYQHRHNDNPTGGTPIRSRKPEPVPGWE